MPDGFVTAAESEPPLSEGPAAPPVRAVTDGRPPFEKVVADHQERMARLIHRLLGWPDDVEDVVQEVFVRALRAWAGFRGDAEVTTWLTRIAVNACRSHRRRRFLRLRLFSGSASTEIALKRPEDGPAIDHETANRVRLAVRSLPGKDREVIVLRYLEEMETREIALVLGISTNNVNVRLHRARERLKLNLSDLQEDLAE
jgi:RNA polymerase sigma-70 factor (ECF subfamily)